MGTYSYNKSQNNQNMGFFKKFWDQIKDNINLSEHVDTEAASVSIRNNINFRGVNTWILAFSIIIASVGLNVNSIPVIIGAMLISPLIGPIFGLGLGLGINDTQLLKDSLRNLLVMVLISLVSSFLYFLITPLSLANPTELLARTNPTIYDVLIAIFGGFAGIIEQTRREKGTVFAGVAIATALMPPLCTAGFGLASGNFAYFFGAIYLFTINSIFITVATYVTVKYLKFKTVTFTDERTAKKTKNFVGIVTFIVIIPSIWSAVIMVKENNFKVDAALFVKANKTQYSAYIYDYHVSHRNGSKLQIFLSGKPLSEGEKDALIISATDYGIKKDQLIITENMVADNGNNTDIIKEIYNQKEIELNKKNEIIYDLEAQIKKYKNEQIPYIQVAKEAANQFPNILEISFSKGANVVINDFSVSEGTLVGVISSQQLEEDEKLRLTSWLKIRLNSNNIVLHLQVKSNEKD